MSKIYFTITGTCFRYGSDFMERGMRVKLVKEPDNKVDSEAIRVEMPGLGKVGYVANSIHTVLGESMSAGRLYDKIGDKAAGKVLYIMEDGVVAVLDEGAATYKESSGSNGASKENDDNNDDDGDGEDDDEDEDFIDVILNLKIGEPIEEEEYEEESEEDNYKDYDYGDDEDVKDEENEDGEEYEDESKYEDGGAAKAGLDSGNNNHGNDYINFSSNSSRSADDDFDEVAMMGLMPGIDVGMPGGGDFGSGGFGFGGSGFGGGFGNGGSGFGGF